MNDLMKSIEGLPFLGPLPADAKMSPLSDSDSMSVSASVAASVFAADGSGLAGKPLMKITFSCLLSSWVKTLGTTGVGFWLARTTNSLFRYILLFPVNGRRHTAQWGFGFALKNVVQHWSQNSCPHLKLKKIRAVPSPSDQQTQHLTFTTTSLTGTGGNLTSSSSLSSSSLTMNSPSSALTSAKMSSTPCFSISSSSLWSSRSFRCFRYFLSFHSSKNLTDLSMSSSAVHSPWRYFASLAVICLNRK